jgi:hypothetical protein
VSARTVGRDLELWLRSIPAQLLGTAFVAIGLVLPAAYAMSQGARPAVVLPLLAALVGPVLFGSSVPWAAWQRRRWRGYGELVARHRPLFVDFFARRGLPPEAIDPLIGMVYQRLCQGGGVPWGWRLRRDAAWTLPVAALVYRDHQLLATSAAHLVAAVPAPAAAVPVPGTTVLMFDASGSTLAGEAGEGLRQLDAALGRLPELTRTCVRLRFERNFSERQVAALTRLPRERVAQILHQALGRLVAGGSVPLDTLEQRSPS